MMTGIYLPIAFLVLFLAIFGTIIGWWLKTRKENKNLTNRE